MLEIGFYQQLYLMKRPDGTMDRCGWSPLRLVVFPLHTYFTVFSLYSLCSSHVYEECRLRSEENGVTKLGHLNVQLCPSLTYCFVAFILLTPIPFLEGLSLQIAYPNITSYHDQFQKRSIEHIQDIFHVILKYCLTRIDSHIR